jgi:lipoprotein signal peptidase
MDKNTHTYYLLVLTSIILIDLITKLIALNVLTLHEELTIIQDKLSFFLVYNEGSTGGQAGYFLETESHKNLNLVFISITGFMIVSYIFLIRKRQIKTLYKWLIGILIYILITISFEFIRPFFTDIEISNWSASIISKVAGITVYLTFFVLVKNSYLRFFTLIIISAGLGNLLSHFYYPYFVIDFIDIKGSYETLKIGVTNFADLFFDFGFLGLIGTIIVISIKKIKELRLTTIKP